VTGAAPPWRQRVGIIGLGLMGGSLARELSACRVRVAGFDRSRRSLALAQRAGALERVLPETLEGLEEVDLLVVAVPVDRAEETLVRALPHLREECVVTDLGSTKRSVQAAAQRLGIGSRFVGSHPLTGSQRSGWGASHRDLYAWRRVFLCPTPETAPEALARVMALWQLVGALPEVVEAGHHDRLVAWISHLPQLAATGLALSLEAAGHPRRELGPGGQDTTRLAASSPEMWSAICIDNADLIETALAGFELQLGRLREAIARRDEPELRRLFAEARKWAEEQPGAEGPMRKEIRKHQ
jgi:prephenate dehydrogenase